MLAKLKFTILKNNEGKKNETKLDLNKEDNALFRLELQSIHYFLSRSLRCLLGFNAEETHLQTQLAHV